MRTVWFAVYRWFAAVWVPFLLCGCEGALSYLITPGASEMSGQRGRWQERRQEDPQSVASRYSIGHNVGKREGAFTIVLDPGHGGDDFGAIGPKGLLEKNIVLTVALELEPLLREKLGAEVYLTRIGDTELSLAERTAMANNVEADLFISLHVNASRRKRAHGLEVYYLDNTNDNSSMKLAERENTTASAGRLPGDLEFMLSDLIQNAKMDDSIVLAHMVGRAMHRRLSPAWRNVKYLGVKKAPFYVLVGAHMPCILVEMFFVDHAGDAAKLARKDFSHELAYGLYSGIRDYIERREG